MSKGRDGRRLPDVNIESEWMEVERRRYHEWIRAERDAPERTVEEALEQAAQVLKDKGWRITEEER